MMGGIGSFLLPGIGIAIVAAAAWFGRRAILRLAARPVAMLFHLVYYYNPAKTWGNTFWMGARVEKLPLDLWIYQEIIYETKPDVIIETGTNMGGSALYFASLFDLLGRGRVITIDIKDNRPPAHPRIRHLLGSSISGEVVARVKSLLAEGEKVMVVLDSDHAMQHVLEELRIYAPLVSVGQYLVVEDTNVNGHPVGPRFGPGPMEALRSYLRETRDFVVDRDREKLLVSFNPRGYLRRQRPAGNPAPPVSGY